MTRLDRDNDRLFLVFILAGCVVWVDWAYKGFGSMVVTMRFDRGEGDAFACVGGLERVSVSVN